MRIKFGSIVVDGRNKLGGHVYSKNRGGNYVRTNIVPTNPRSEGQMQARGRFAVASAGWKGLNDVQRLAWQQFSEATPYQDLFGDSKILSPNAAYVRSRVNGITAGLASLPTPVEVSEGFVNDEFKLEAIASGQLLAVDFVVADLSDFGNGKLLVYATPNFPPSQKYAGNKFRVIGNYDASDVVSNTLTLSSDYASRFGALVPGMRVAVKVVFIKSNGMSVLVGGGDVIVSA